MIVSNTSPLILLANIGKLDLIEKIYTDVLIPEYVYTECIRDKKPFSEELERFLQGKIQEVKDRKGVENLMLVVDKGEAEAIQLVLEKGIDKILIDDLKGRNIAIYNGLSVIGTVGLLIKAKKEGHIEEIKLLLEELEKAGMRISKTLKLEALALTGED
ncbi:MAG: DUF3368 domain-containing protein [Spirochaetales bacterium]|nr:DUF3368 domain-containing protein [Spirochaetales bacterium]